MNFEKRKFRLKLPPLLQPRVLKQALLAILSRPYTTRFPDVPYQPPPGFRGRVRFDADACIGCGACAEVCPPKCIDVVDDVESDTPNRTLIQHVDACIWCGQCERYCPTEKGIRLTSEYIEVGFRPEDFEERVEKELLLCEVCGESLAPVDQLRWLVNRLGPLAFSNPTLMLVAGRDLGIVDQAVKTQGATVQRADRLRIQCPKCRRATALHA
ncbi:MAG: 4Fe-4S dicluster domain-containing protein [Pirellulaceae bacterium]|nr:4Fe-4S dicluster domain-containing protein [Pirellulaceae bacterium]